MKLYGKDWVLLQAYIELITNIVLAELVSNNIITQLAFICSKSTIEALRKGMKSV